MWTRFQPGLKTDGSTESVCDGRQLVHLDLKSPNVLLQDKNCLVAKIADLGVSKYLVEGSLLDFTMRGAPARPPGADQEHSAHAFLARSGKHLRNSALDTRGAPTNPAL